MSSTVLSADANCPLPLDTMVDMTVQLCGLIHASTQDSQKPSVAELAVAGPPGPAAGKRGSKRRRVVVKEAAHSSSYIDLLRSKDRGDSVFVSADATAIPEQALMGTMLTALTSVFKTPAPASQVTFPVAPVSTVTHENKQLVWGRAGLPLCESGRDCTARMLPGAVINGELPCYLYPEEQIAYEAGGIDAIKSQLKMSSPRFCLLCIRAMAETTKLAAEALKTGSSQTFTSHVVAPPFCNLVDVIDGYRESALAVRPTDMCMAGGISLCGVSRGLAVRFNKMGGDGGQWFVHQTDEIVYKPGAPPSL